MSAMFGRQESSCHHKGAGLAVFPSDQGTVSPFSTVGPNVVRLEYTPLPGSHTHASLALLRMWVV